MSSKLRSLVSKKKRRYQDGAFDLDLTYVTPRLIAMGFPSTGAEALYRNPAEAVQEMLNAKHGAHYRVYNLCCERSYPPTLFNNNVVTYGFADHNAPPFDILVRCIQDMGEWMSQSVDNVCAVHCKAGKGRTGVVLCCYLLYSGEYTDAEDAMAFYGQMRTHNAKGVTIPSQRRFIHYFASALQQNCLSRIPSRRLFLRRIGVVPAPHITKGIRVKITGMELYGDSLKQLVSLYRSEDLARVTNPEQLVIDLPGVLLHGNFDIALKQSKKDKPFLHFWAHTSFIEAEAAFHKHEIDGPHKDRKHKLCPSNTQVILYCEEEMGCEQPISLLYCERPTFSSPTHAAPFSEGGRGPNSPSPPDSCDDDEEYLPEKHQNTQPNRVAKPNFLARNAPTFDDNDSDEYDVSF
eukprot:TRINITY_DN94090_c0_g1_i1.p1 TRINITY_DN94090_c0_g1~~TRINITY_DN94090_c0_g1_i1.p1  ORF type:complete len:406 (-),score=30.82 TRINITY_DN94090_c0_g1_i1:4-1221(-)